MKPKLEVGSIVEVNFFCFTNKFGGTGLSDDPSHKFKGKAKLRITKVWDDYETGIKGWGEPVSGDLRNFLLQNAAQTEIVHDFDPDNIVKIPVNTVFWDEYAVL